jgi:hypothetical protein
MRPPRTFEAIKNVLRDGSWHEIDELRAATHFPAEWVQNSVRRASSTQRTAATCECASQVPTPSLETENGRPGRDLTCACRARAWSDDSEVLSRYPT